MWTNYQIKILKLPETTSNILADYVVGFRSFNIEKEYSIICMQELLRRRELGEDFNFEDFINEKIKNLPKTNTDVNFSSIISQFIKK